MIFPDNLDESRPDDIRFLAPTLAQDQNVCPDQRFVDQPVPVVCSGTLVDDDLVLSAAHCVRDLARCQALRFVFGFYLSAKNQLARVTRDDVFRCRRLVTAHREVSPATILDYAVVQLDRPATPRFRPAPVKRAVEPVSPGEPLTLLGFPGGLPAKISPGGFALDRREGVLDFFTASVDGFEGNSGAGIFDRQGRLVGIDSRGGDPHRLRGGCHVVRMLPPDGSEGSEVSTYVFRALQALCATGWRSRRLCPEKGR
jgi:hypothetical protein